MFEKRGVRRPRHGAAAAGGIRWRAAVLAVALAAAGCRGSVSPSFDGESSFRFLAEQCDLGPRYPGSPGHEAARRYLAEALERFGATVSFQPFDAVLSTGDTLHGVNIIGSYRPKHGTRILLGAHYDTRPRADRDPDPANRAKPILGANDGASGVAVLLETARLLGESEPPVGVDIVLFDCEDYGEEGSTRDYILGSRHHVAALAGRRPSAVVVVDMVGERGVRLPIEGFSEAASPGLVSSIYAIAADIGAAGFIRERGQTIIDDHFPFIQAGIPAVDLIDFDYPFWHTLADTPDKCAPESLDAVGEVLVRFVWGAR